MLALTKKSRGGILAMLPIRVGKRAEAPLHLDGGLRFGVAGAKKLFPVHILAGGDRTAWLAFLNTVRTEHFDQVLALRPDGANPRGAGWAGCGQF